MTDRAIQTAPDRLWVRLIAPFSEIRTAKLQTPGTLTYPGADAITVQFRHSFEADKDAEEYSSFSDCIGIATVHCPVPPKARNALLAGHVVPRTYGPDDDEGWDPEAIPGSVMDIIKTVAPKLRHALNDTYKVLRWRYKHPGGAFPFARDYLQWSENGLDWSDLPPDTFRPFEFNLFELGFTEDVAREVEALLCREDREPVAHELFREAWGQRLENTRSAIVVGIASAETGLKSFIAKRVPEAAWLVTEAPSPDLLKMLTAFLPSLLRDQDGNLLFSTAKKKSGYEDDVLRELHNGVTIRNDIVHKPGKGDSPSLKAVRSVLEAVRDLLYLLDYHNANTWAEGHIRAKVREAWHAGRNVR